METNTAVIEQIPNAKTELTQSAFTCSKLTIQTLEQGMKYVPS